MRVVALIRMKGWQLVICGIGLIMAASLAGLTGFGVFATILTMGDLREDGLAR